MVEGRSVKIDRRVSAVLDLDAFHDLVPQLGGGFGRASRKDSSPSYGV